MQTVGTETVVEGSFSSSSISVDGLSYKGASGSWYSPVPTPVNSVSGSTSKEESIRLAAGVQEIRVSWLPSEYGVSVYYIDTFSVGERIGSDESTGVSWAWFING